MESNAPPPSANDAMDEWFLTAVPLAVASPASALLAEADRKDRVGDTDCVSPRWGSSMGELEMPTAAARGASMDRCAVPCREVCAFRQHPSRFCDVGRTRGHGTWWDGGGENKPLTALPCLRVSGHDEPNHPDFAMLTE